MGGCANNPVRVLDHRSPLTGNRAYGTRSPYPTDGFVYVTHTDKGINGSIILALDLPETKTPLAKRIVDSFVLG